ELEIAVAQTEQAIDRRFTLQAAHRRVDHGPVAEPYLGLAEFGAEVDRAALATDLDRLEQIDDGHVGEAPGELGPRRIASLQALVLLALQQQDRKSTRLNSSHVKISY